ncbi:hypothetical protein JL720_4585 [Aureococcus anophagefferens]|nr:hypothetical protein JL720_4585 [Aureococcus anophagefferens]
MAMNYGPMQALAVVTAKKGALLRQGIDMDTAYVGDVAKGTQVVVCGQGVTRDGVPRYELASPLRWCSARVLSPPQQAGAGALAADVICSSRRRRAQRDVVVVERRRLSDDDDVDIAKIAERSDARRGYLAPSTGDPVAASARAKLWTGDCDGAEKLALGGDPIHCLGVLRDARKARDALKEADARFREAVQKDASPDELEGLLERMQVYIRLAPRCQQGAGLQLAVLLRLKWHDASAAALERMLDSQDSRAGLAESFTVASLDLAGTPRRRALAEKLEGARAAYFECLRATCRWRDAAALIAGMIAHGKVGEDQGPPLLAELRVLGDLYAAATKAAKANKRKAAARAFGDASDRAPDHVLLLCEYSEALLLASDAPAACEKAALAVQLAPTFAPARCALAKALQVLEDVDAAVEQYEIALHWAHDPDAANAVFRALHRLKKHAASGNAFFKGAFGGGGDEPAEESGDVDADVAAAVNFAARRRELLALKHHPDRAADRNKGARRKAAAPESDAMARINAAYEILATKEKRHQYDDAYTAVMRARKRGF